MIITIVTVAALIAVTIYGLGQRSKLKIAKEELSDVETVNSALRLHMNRLESEMTGDKDYIKTLRSDLQSCKDKARASAVKAVQRLAPAPVENKISKSKPTKAAPAIAPAKPRKPYKKKDA
jgi:hypothetical protein